MTKVTDARPDISDQELLDDYAENERDVMMFELARQNNWTRIFDLTLYRMAVEMRDLIGDLIDARGLQRPPGPCGEKQ